MSHLSRAACIAGLALFATSALAQQTPPTVKRDPKVQAVIDQTLAAYRALNGLHLKVSVKTTGPSDMMRGAPDSIELKYQKPNKLYSAIATRGAKETLDRRLVVSDGSNLWAWLSDTNTYNKVKAPPLLKTAPFIGHDLPEYDLLFRDKDPFADLPGTATLALGPAAKVGDVDVDVLKTSATEQGVPFTLNIELMIGQKDHLIHGMYFAGSGKDQGKDVKFDLRMTYDLVAANPAFTAADFAFTPPPGAKPALSTQPAKPSSAAEKPGSKK